MWDGEAQTEAKMEILIVGSLDWSYRGRLSIKQSRVFWDGLESTVVTQMLIWR